VISGRTITQTVTFGSVGTQPAYASPLTITSTGGINVNTGNAIVGPTGNPWTVVNQGLVTAPGVFGNGIDLLSGGSVTNGSNGAAAAYSIVAAATQSKGASGAVITAALIGVDISGGTGTVVNYGTITGTSVWISAAASPTAWAVRRVR
jgi:hypothetical protein